MFNLETYKEDLVNYYRWGKDNTEEERNKRREMLKGKDEYLSKIISDTEEFIYFILTKMKEENHIFNNHIYIYLDLIGEEASIYSNSISFNLTGGWPSDSLFYLEDPTKLISKRLLKSFFGCFLFECDCEDKEIYDEKEDIGWIESKWQISLSGPIEDFNKLYAKAQELKGQELVNVLKRIRTNKTK